MTVYEHSLPWVGHYSMLLIAAKTDAVGSILEKVSPVDDPGPTTITLQTGETSAGKIHLASRFPGLLDALKDRDVIVFWSYRFQPIDMAPLQRAAGHVLFPKLTTEGEVEIEQI